MTLVKLQSCIVLWQHTLQKYRNGCCQECKYSETQFSKLSVKTWGKVTYLLSLRNVRTIDATVWRLRFGWTLRPASLMERPWLTTWSMMVALISFEHLILTRPLTGAPLPLPRPLPCPCPRPCPRSMLDFNFNLLTSFIGWEQLDLLCTESSHRCWRYLELREQFQ